MTTPSILILESTGDSILLSDELKREGFNPLYVTDMDSALGIIDANKPEAILIDLDFCVKDGSEIFRQMRKRFAALRIIIMAEYYRMDLAMDAVLEGADGVLKKPVLKLDMLITLGLRNRKTSRGLVPVNIN